jgi:hypothetical protein
VIKDDTRGERAVQVGRLGRLLAAAVTTVGLWSAHLEPAHAAAPPAPAALQATASNPPVLSWGVVPGAVRYQVQVDNEPAFTSPAIDRTTVNTTYVGSTPLAASDYYWQVRAIDADGLSSDWAAGSSFTVAPVTPPANLSPDGATLAQPDQPVRLRWDVVPGATSYTVEVGTDSGFVGAKTYASQVNTLVVPDPPVATGYFWHVKAALAPGIESPYSATATYTAGSIPVPGGLRTVASDGATTTDPTDVQDVVLGWDPVPGARSYNLQVSKDDTFTGASLIDNRTGLLSTQYSPTTTYDNSQYFWRVSATDVGGNVTAWSAMSTFRRQWTEQPVALLPDPSTDAVVVHDPVTLEWTPVHHASHYQVQLGADPNFSPGTYSLCLTAGTTYTPGGMTYNVLTGQASRKADDKCLPAPGTITYWRVRGLDTPFAGTGVQGLWSDTHSFIASTDGDRLTGSSPADGATVDLPVLSWDPVRGAETYAVAVKLGSTTVSSVTTHSTSFVPQQLTGAPLAAGTYTWSVTAKDPVGTPLSLTQVRTFTVSGAIPSDGSAPLTALTGGTTASVSTRAPLLTWTPYAGTAGQKISYTISAGQHGTGTWFNPADSTITGNLLEKTLAYPAVTDPSTVFSKPGAYDWQVTAYADGTPVATSPVYTFTIADLAAVGGQRHALGGSGFAGGATCAAAVGAATACSAVPATPVLEWQPVAGASFYVVYLADDSHFTNRLEADTAMPATTSTRWAPTYAELAAALPDSKVGESYFVHVRACSSLTSCGADPSSSTGRASMQFTKTSPAVALRSPAAAAAVGSPAVTFAWHDYRDTSGATTWPGGSGTATSYQSAKQYRLQVGTDPTFATTLEDVKVDQTTYTAPTRLYPEGTLYWRVQAVDGDDNGLSWSPTRSFTKATPAPTLTAPLGGAAAGETAVLSWQPKAYAASYDVQLYKGGDTALSPSNQVFNATGVKQPAYVWNKPLPAAGSPYLWRVRAKDAFGNYGPWTAVSLPATSFTVSGATPAMTSPAAGATVPTGQVVLRWNPVPRAATYQVNVQSHAGSTSIDSASTAATAYAPSPTTLITPGAVDWRVIAKDSAGNELGSSGWRTLDISDLTDHLTATTAPRITGTPVVGSTLTATSGTWSATSPRISYQWLRDGSPITNAIGSTYRPALADATHRIAVRVTATKSGWGKGVATTAAVLVPKAVSTTRASASPTLVKRGATIKLSVTVSAPGVYPGPTGKVRIYDKLGTRTPTLVTTRTLYTSSSGRLTVGVRMGTAGTHRLRATYLGNASTRGSSSPWAQVTVTRG